MATTPDIINKGLLDLYSARADREKAQLDLQRAMAREQMLGRTTVPSVFAQLKQKHEQEQAKAQKIKEAGQPTPAAMLPPAVDMTGTPQQSSAAGSAAEAINNLVSGGGGIKTGAIGGAATAPAQGQNGQGVGGGFGAPFGGGPLGVMVAGDPAMGAIAAGAQAAFPQAAAAANQMGGVAPPQAPPTQGEPGSLVPEMGPPLSTTQRVVRGVVGGLGGLLTKNPLGAMKPIEQAITGEEEPVGYKRLPTVEESAAPYAKTGGALVYAMKTNAPDSDAFKQAQQQYSNMKFLVGKLHGSNVADSFEMQSNALAIQSEQDFTDKIKQKAFENALISARERSNMKAEFAQKQGTEEAQAKEWRYGMVSKMRKGYKPTVDEVRAMESYDRASPLEAFRAETFAQGQQGNTIDQDAFNSIRDGIIQANGGVVPDDINEQMRAALKQRGYQVQ